MDADRPWRLADLKFQDDGGTRPGEIGPAIVVENGGKYSLTVVSHRLKLSWHNLEDSGRPALDLAFDASIIGRKSPASLRTNIN
jgi:hypothetical protein